MCQPFLHQPHEPRRLQRRHVRTTKLLHWKWQSWLWDLTRNLHCCRVSRNAITKAKEALDAAKAKVVSLEASIQALGDADLATLKVLQDALAKARTAANGAPVGVRLDSCAKYVERKKRLLAKCDEDMAKLQTLRASVEEELKAGVARLESLRAEAAVPMPQPQVPNPTWKMCPACSKSSTSCNGS